MRRKLSHMPTGRLQSLRLFSTLLKCVEHQIEQSALNLSPIQIRPLIILTLDDDANLFFVAVYSSDLRDVSQDFRKGDAGPSRLTRSRIRQEVIRQFFQSCGFRAIEYISFRCCSPASGRSAVTRELAMIATGFRIS